MNFVGFSSIGARAGFNNNKHNKQPRKTDRGVPEVVYLTGADITRSTLDELNQILLRISKGENVSIEDYLRVANLIVTQLDENGNNSLLNASSGWLQEKLTALICYCKNDEIVDAKVPLSKRIELLKELLSKYKKLLSKKHSELFKTSVHFLVAQEDNLARLIALYECYGPFDEDRGMLESISVKVNPNSLKTLQQSASETSTIPDIFQLAIAEYFSNLSDVNVIYMLPYFKWLTCSLAQDMVVSQCLALIRNNEYSVDILIQSIDAINTMCLQTVESKNALSQIHCILYTSNKDSIPAQQHIVKLIRNTSNTMRLITLLKLADPMQIADKALQVKLIEDFADTSFEFEDEIDKELLANYVELFYHMPIVDNDVKTLLSQAISKIYPNIEGVINTVSRIVKEFPQNIFIKTWLSPIWNEDKLNDGRKLEGLFLITNDNLQHTLQMWILNYDSEDKATTSVEEFLLLVMLSKDKATTSVEEFLLLVTLSRAISSIDNITEQINAFFRDT